MRKNIMLSTGTQKYSVTIGKITSLKFEDKDVLLVTSKNLEHLYLEYMLSIIKAKSVNVCVVDDGEMHKNMQTIDEILESAFKHKLHRNALMIALGGGVITDMVGFASGIFQRGIDFISIPTTLLAMVDASVGGKCGVNNKYGKNLIGLFHQPKQVFVAPMFLRTLPERELLAGVAEIIKIFACFEYSLLQNFNMLDIEFYIQKSIELKAQVVEKDEKERHGLRALLNYGHTFGHAIELEGGYSEFLHGEAVSMGIVMANRLSVKLGILSSDIDMFICALLKRIGLPTHYKIKDIDSFYNAFFYDKKSLDSKLHFILLESKEVIKATVHNNIDKQIIYEVLHEFA
ncbi:3-dehydroquinate synthase [Helicobacter trogontum]|uniref:3-dehydroquinate synthase n=1 Tax=Helicobacter trogontum TaxID=50960 RepID=A0A4U8SCD6_9HELI|nr:3-dehydroquinate synthase [Helicobacter trogontum]TLD83745.1 3-dehydroquinate synthase [Helicobacter trogontum]